LISKRTVLIAESAHVMPPTGAQGLNTSVEDIIALHNICKKALESNKDLGAHSVLRQYSINRFPLTGSKVFGVHLLNKVSMTENSFVKNARKNVLMYLNQSPFLRRTLIKAGLGK
jgi:2-octaprenyl-6-methoxyphenol hydroxylase